MAERPIIAVSQCLLGARVRYDGESKTSQIVCAQLGALFQLLPICPEVEAGLGVPRPPVQLCDDLLQPRMQGRDDPTLDVTVRILSYSARKIPELEQIAGYVFKSRSPSCGLNSTPVFSHSRCLSDTSRGLFARAVCLRYPDLPVIEDSELESATALQAFIDAVMARIKIKT